MSNVTNGWGALWLLYSKKYQIVQYSIYDCHILALLKVNLLIMSAIELWYINVTTHQTNLITQLNSVSFLDFNF